MLESGAVDNGVRQSAEPCFRQDPVGAAVGMPELLRKLFVFTRVNGRLYLPGVLDGWSNKKPFGASVCEKRLFTDLKIVKIVFY